MFENLDRVCGIIHMLKCGPFTRMCLGQILQSLESPISCLPRVSGGFCEHLYVPGRNSNIKDAHGLYRLCTKFYSLQPRAKKNKPKKTPKNQNEVYACSQSEFEQVSSVLWEGTFWVLTLFL